MSMASVLDYLPLLILLAIGLLVLAPRLPRWRMRLLVGHPAPELGGLPGQQAGGAADALYFFFSPSCNRCKGVGAAVDRLAAEGRPVVRVDVSVEGGLARRFGVREVPCVVVVEGGRVTRVLAGPGAAGRLGSTAGRGPLPGAR
jgi:hypothetical protein